MQLLNPIVQVVILLFSTILHEISHGFAAYIFGDNTAKSAGRLSFNPLKHIDPFGSIILPGLLKLSGSSFIVGYAKPVPINPHQFIMPRLGTICVSLAGPISNIFLAGLLIILLKLFSCFGYSWNDCFYVSFLLTGIMINCALFLFNMLPILPLDGGRVFTALMPERMAKRISVIEPFGILIVIGICALGPYLEEMSGIPLDFMGRVFLPIYKWLYISLVSLAIPA